MSLKSNLLLIWITNKTKTGKSLETEHRKDLFSTRKTAQMAGQIFIMMILK